MQRFMVICFHQKAEQQKLATWLQQMQDEGRYAAPDMQQFSFTSDVSGIVLIENSNMDLGRVIKDMGYNVRHQQWVTL